LSSEVIAVGARAGRSVSSRIDPLEIPSSIAIYVAKGNDADWTVDVTQAKHEKGKPQLYGRRETDKKGRASLINHSFVAPSISDIAGGITCDHALHTVVLSLTVLRKLRFVRDLVDAPLPKEASLAARTSLAALALAGIVRQRAEGFALRSRCWLVPSAPLVFEIVTIDGGLETFTLSVAEADALVRDASAEARRHRLPWTRVPLRLRPAPKLTALVRKTRARGQGRELDEAP
jgi:CRISPR-associated protein Csb1